MSDARIRFLVSPHQNLFFSELAAALVDELQQIDVSADVVTSVIDPDDRDVYVVMPTHEYVKLEGEFWLDDDAVARRTIGITAEQPSTSHFTENVELAPRLGAVFDISAKAVSAYNDRGIAAHRLQIGWTRTWDHFLEAPEYDRDLLFIGAYSDRRVRALSGMSRALWEYKSRLIISDNSSPNWKGTSNFVAGEAKRTLMSRSRILLNIHQHDELYFEHLRAVEAAHCGVVMLSEPATHREGFENDECLVLAPIASMPHRIDELLGNSGELARLRVGAYDSIRQNPMSVGAKQLAETARELAARSPIARNLVGPRRVTPLRPPIKPPWEVEPTPLDEVRQALMQVRLDLNEIRKPKPPPGTEGLPNLVVDHDSRSWDSKPGRVSVIMALYNHSQYVVDALESAVSGGFADVEVVIVDDGSTDDSARVVREWIDRTPHRAIRLLRHRLNSGLPRSRNDALSQARGDYVFVLDADNELVPTGMQRLVAALDGDATASFAYGVLQKFDSEGPQGLLGYFPWQPWRLRYGNYIDAMTLIRRSALLDLGGYVELRSLYGWEDYDLWCRFAECGAHAVHVPTVVARYRASRSSMISLSNLSHTAAFDALRERAPQLMSGALEDWEHPLTDWLSTVRRTYAAHAHLLSELGAASPLSAADA